MLKSAIPIAVIVLLVLLAIFGACLSRDKEQKPFVIAWNYDTSGYLETCGCSSHQLGGLARRATKVAELRASNPVLAIEGAHFVEGSGEFQLFKGEIILRSLNEMGYSAVMLGSREAEHGKEGLSVLAAASNAPCFSANLQIDGDNWENTYAVAEVAGNIVGITGVTQLEFASEGLPEGIGFADPAVSLDSALGEVSKMADMVVVCLEGEQTWIQGMVDAYRGRADLFLSGNRSPVTGSLEFDGSGPLLNNWKYGKYLGLVTASPGAAGYSFAGLSVPLEEEIPENEGILAILDDVFRPQLKDRFFSNMKADLEQLYLPPQACETCHPDAYESYVGSSHAKAMDTLFEAGQLYNPDCMSCHLVYDADMDELHAINCVVCHTNITDQHIWDAVGEKVERPEEPVTRYNYQSCVGCHDELNSLPFEDYWPLYMREIYHGGDLSEAEDAAAQMGLDMEAPLPDMQVMH